MPVMKLAYPANITEQGRTLVVTFPDLPGLVAKGVNRPQAITAARAVLVAALRAYAKEHRDIPRPSAGRVRDLVDLPVLTAAKAALYQTMRDQNVSNVALAKRLQTVEGTVRRLVDFGHRSHIDQVEAALRLLGKRLVVDLRLR